MAPKRLFSPDEPPTASSPSCEQDDEPSSTIPPIPSFSSDSESDSEHRWIIKPIKPNTNAKKAKKNSDRTFSPQKKKFAAAEQGNANANGANTTVDGSTEMSEDVSKKAEQDKKWNDPQFAVLDLEIYIKCVQLIGAQAKLICDAYKSSENH